MNYAVTGQQSTTRERSPNDERRTLREQFDATHLAYSKKPTAAAASHSPRLNAEEHRTLTERQIEELAAVEADLLLAGDRAELEVHRSAQKRTEVHRTVRELHRTAQKRTEVHRTAPESTGVHIYVGGLLCTFVQFCVLLDIPPARKAPYQEDDEVDEEDASADVLRNFDSL